MMKPPQNHPSISGIWYRCSEVEIVGADLKWKLSRSSNGRYNLLDAYKYAPHHQLIADARDDDHLLKFIKSWGLLVMFRPTTWEGKTPIAVLRSERDRFLAWANLLAAVGNSDRDLRERACESIKVSGVPTIWIRSRLGLRSGEAFDDELHQKILGATYREIDDIVDYLVGSTYPLQSSPIIVVRNGKKRTVQATTGVDSLIAALYWMLWQDYFKANPYSFCVECGRLFPSGLHNRKYCPDRPCSKKREKREYMKRKAKAEVLI